MKLVPKVGLCVVRHPFEEGAERAPELHERAAEGLRAAGIEVVPGGVAGDLDSGKNAGMAFRSANVDAVCIAAATWSSDGVSLEVLERAAAPAITWGLPGINTGSLCAVHQLDCVLKEIGWHYRFAYGQPDETAVYARIRCYALAAAVRKRLRTARIGQIGGRVEGMTEVAFDEFSLKKVFGPIVMRIPVADFLDRRDSVEGSAASEVWEKAKAMAGGIEVPDEDGLRSSRGYLALRRICQDNDLAALTAECYPKLMGEVCLAYSLLAEEGIAASCEGDVNSAMLTLILQWLSGEPVHNTDLLTVFEEDNTVLGSHCGSAGFSLADGRESVTLSHVRLANRGVCVLFPAKPGPVTWANLVGREGTYRLTSFGGEAVRTEMLFAGNPLLTKVNTPVRELLDRIADIGAGHHWMACCGHVQSELRELARLIGIQYEEIG